MPAAYALTRSCKRAGNVRPWKRADGSEAVVESFFRASGTNFVEQLALLPPEVTTTLTTTVNPGVAADIKYGTVAFPCKFATDLLSVLVVLYLAVAVTPARATVDTRTLVVEYCLGLASLMDARHASVAAKAAGASSTALTELKLRLSTVASATRKLTLDRWRARRWDNCEPITTDSNPIKGRAKGRGEA